MKVKKVVKKQKIWNKKEKTAKSGRSQEIDISKIL